MPSLYLIPVPLGETPIDHVLPPHNREVILTLRHFIVENVRSARRFLKKVEPNIDIDSLTFYELNEHTPAAAVEGFLKPLSQGESMGVISEAGCPAVADPGADVVALAQRRGMKVVPLVGPCSMVLAIMASGFNGQSFAFHGYLPTDAAERRSRLKALESRAYSESQTQLFIETPYRNLRMFADILAACRPSTRLCVAAGLTCPDEYAVTCSIADWRRKTPPPIDKVPCIFLLYKG
ncbi:MAG: SAM-dependent methyltransferase [Bacteroidaceae bacterium]|nr:SAM-dependent methyltransferase [Bacteroidaceae bacterium]MBR4779546.1 SAM-dependent methyltransferase [Bacteroidaceae bacterium]